MTFRQISAFLLISAVALSAMAGDDGFQLMRSEAIGLLQIGDSRTHAIKLVGASPRFGKKEEWGADGQFHQQVDFVKAGVSLSLVSESRTSPQTVESITVVAPCTLKTKKGIHIGSTESELMKAYGPQYNKEESTPGSLFIAGSTYGGLSFEILGGKATRIFIGAASE